MQKYEYTASASTKLTVYYVSVTLVSFRNIFYVSENGTWKITLKTNKFSIEHNIVQKMFELRNIIFVAFCILHVQRFSFRE